VNPDRKVRVDENAWFGIHCSKSPMSAIAPSQMSLETGNSPFEAPIDV
jgi:hypothetical protein